jgi:hypothetical protein
VGKAAEAGRSVISDARRRAVPLEYDGPLINQRLPATIELVQSWCRKVKAPILTDDDAAAMAREVNHALLLEAEWRDESKAARDEELSTQRMRRIADAMATLQADLPKLIEDSRRFNPDADLSPTENLLEVLSRHQAIIDADPRRKKGRCQSLEKNLTTNLAKKVLHLWGQAATKRAGDAFAAVALTWLTGRLVPTSDEATRKARERRTKRG